MTTKPEVRKQDNEQTTAIAAELARVKYANEAIPSLRAKIVSVMELSKFEGYISDDEIAFLNKFLTDSAAWA